MIFPGCFGSPVFYIVNKGGRFFVRFCTASDCCPCKVSAYSYDNGLLISESHPLGYSSKSYQYDERELLTSTTDFNGQIYDNTYYDYTDELKRLSSAHGGVTMANNFGYANGALASLEHNGFSYGFDFDPLGRQTAVRVAGAQLFSKQYAESDTAETETVSYASGEQTVLTVDHMGNPVSRTYKGANDSSPRTVFSVEYNGAGNIKKYIDNEAGICYNYNYNSRGQVVSVTETYLNGNTLRVNTYVYDELHRLLVTTYGATGQSYAPIYESNSEGYASPDDAVIGVTLDNKFTDSVTKDNLNRAAKRTVTVGGNKLIEENYSYLDGANETTTDMISTVVTVINGTENCESYFYDDSGNITELMADGEQVATYYYDRWHRLIKEIDHRLGKVYTYSYDIGGNITEKRIYDGLYTENYVSKLYTYATDGNRDRLIAYNGQNCVYDVLGNPTIYRGNSLTWTKVRRLASYGSNTFEYNAQGLRIRKNDKTYVLDGDKILRETDGTNTITYYYGGNGVIGFNYNGSDYYYRKNILGDVMEIYTASGVKVASYAYDAWGNHKIYDIYGDEVTDNSHIGYINPIRYRGYYYDTETNLYYLQTRYYDPEIGRFINADAIEYLVPEQVMGLNLYAYCGNNPVMYTDSSGCFVITTVLATIAWGALIGGVISAAFAVGDQIKQNGTDSNEWDWEQIGRSTLGGVVAGAISATPIGGFGGALAFGAVGSLFGGLISGSVNSIETAVISMSIGALANGVACGISNKISKIQAGKIFNQSRKTKSLTVQKLQSHPLNMGHKVLKGKYRNAFKNATQEDIRELLNNANPMFRHGLYSAITSSILSGWY